MATQATYFGDGTNRDFGITFPYRTISDIALTVDGVAVGFTLPTLATVRATIAPAAGTRVTVARSTLFNTPDVDFQDGAVLTENDLDAANLQLFYRLQEVGDGLTSLKGRSLLFPEGSNVSLPNPLSLAGRYLSFDAAGNPVGASGVGADAALRVDLASTVAGAALIAYGVPGRSLKARMDEQVSVKDYGAKGDGVTNDSPAFALAFAASKNVFIPFGRYFLATPVRPRDGTRLSGLGKAAWEPYDTSTSTNPLLRAAAYLNFKSQLEVNGTLAIDLSSTNNVELYGLSILARGGGVSGYGAAAKFQTGSIGIDITASSQAEMSNISFHGLQVGVDSNQLRAPSSAQMPRVTDWMANDNDIVFRFGNSASAPRFVGDPNPYTVRDPYIGPNVIALHNNKVYDVHYADGLRIENQRLFQADTSAYIRATPFLAVIGVTFFETKNSQLVIEDSVHVSLVGLAMSRAGAYAATQPFAQRAALVIRRTPDVSFTGNITQPTGRAVQVEDSPGVSLNGAIREAFWTTGNATSVSGSIQVTGSDAPSINMTETGGAHYVGPWLDEVSSWTATGNYSTDGPQGTVRFPFGPRNLTHVVRNPAENGVGPGGSSAVFSTLRVRIPAGKSLVTRSVQMTSPGIRLRSGAVYWADAAQTVSDTDGGSVNFERKVLATNGGSTPGWFTVPLMFYNPSGGAVFVPEGHETRISFGFE